MTYGQGARARSEIVERLAELEDEKYGRTLLRLLTLADWDVAITSRFGGGVVVALRKAGVGQVSDHGDTVATIAPGLFTAAVELQRGADLERVALRVVE